MPRARTTEELIAGMEFSSKGRGRTIAEFARREAMLTAADEVEKIMAANGGDFDHFHDLKAWITATREEAAIAAAEYEKR